MELPGTSKPSMVAKKRVTNCPICNERLRLPLSKVHCEICGMVFCKICCQKEIPLAYKKLDDGRVCNSCFHEGLSYVHVLIIWLRIIGKIAIDCVDCGQLFTLGMKRYGCLACQQTICDRCIPRVSIGQGEVVSKCRRCQYREHSEESLTIMRMEEEMTKIQIKLIFLIADSCDGHNTRINTAETALSAVGVVGGSLAIIGFGLSFTTFGASLILTAVGAAIGGATGVAQVSAQISRFVINKQSWKTLKKISDRIQEVKVERWKLHVVGTFGTGAGTAGSVASLATATTRLANIGDDVATAAQTGATVGKLATRTTTASKTLFSSLGKAGRVLHFGGVVFSAAGIGIDVYTIVDRSIKLHKKKPAEAAENMRRLAYRLLGPRECLPSTCERRVVDRGLSHLRALF